VVAHTSTLGKLWIRPFHGRDHQRSPIYDRHRIIDLPEGAASELGIVRACTSLVMLAAEGLRSCACERPGGDPETFSPLLAYAASRPRLSPSSNSCNSRSTKHRRGNTNLADINAAPAAPFKTVPTPRDQHLRDMADCIRFLSMDAVQKAKSGHPGAPNRCPICLGNAPQS
jgi:hypothetical protein